MVRASKNHRRVNEHEHSETGRYLLRRSEPGGGQRTGRTAARPHRPERYRQPPQSHGHRRRHHLPDREGPSADPYFLCRTELRSDEGQRDPAGADLSGVHHPQGDHLSQIKNDKGIGFYIPVILVTYLGAMTHYYCIVYSFFISAVYGIYLLFKKDYKGVLYFCITMAIAGLLSYITFPPMINHIFSGYRGQEATSNFFDLSDYITRFIGVCNDTVLYCDNNQSISNSVNPFNLTLA